MKAKIFPLKLSDHLYNDLKYVARNTNQPMSAIVRSYFAEPIQKQAQQLKKTKKSKQLLSEFLDTNLYQGEWHHQDQTDDELIYGEENG